MYATPNGGQVLVLIVQRVLAQSSEHAGILPLFQTKALIVSHYAVHFLVRPKTEHHGEVPSILIQSIFNLDPAVSLPWL